MFRSLILLLTTLAFIAGCAHTPPPDDGEYDDAASYSSGDPMDACDINSLASLQDSLMARVEDMSDLATPAPGKIHAFRGEIDAQYRAVASSCRSYMQCMDMNDYSEADCRSSQLRWMTAEERFTRLSVRLAELEVELARAGQSRKKHHGHKSRRSRGCSSCDTFGPMSACCH